jgi:hypothetical protein
MQITRGVSSSAVLAALLNQNVGANSFTGNAGGFLGLSSRFFVRGDADGVVRLTNTAESNFVRLSFGQNTASYPALQLGSGGLQVVSADNSVWMPLNAERLGLRADTMLERDAADQLAMRRGLNAQTFRVYNTYTDASNYERGHLAWSSNILELATVAAGTGSNRNLRLNGAGTIIDITSNDVQVYRNGTSSATIMQVLGTGLTSTALLHTRLAPSINQASGTYTVLDINPTETAIGAGPHYLIRGRIGAGGNIFSVDRTGIVNAAAGFASIRFAGSTRFVDIGDGLVGFADSSLNGAATRYTPMTAPGNPASGWYIYTDTADGKLKAKNGSGTVRELAIP